MSYLIVCGVALLASALTLLSGFGLGTLLLPAFALFFRVEVAVAATAVVHLLNNLFKLVLVGRAADRRVVLAFGLPALGGAVLGAWLLTSLARLPELASYELLGRVYSVAGAKLVVGLLILVFATLELLPARDRLSFRPAMLPLGGSLSGFFGGLSGHQGALRSAFLIQCGLSKEAFIGSGVACAVLVDLARIGVYGTSFFGGLVEESAHGGGRRLILAAVVAAFAGAWIGARLMKKVTLGLVRRLVGVMLILLAVALGAGWI